MKLPLNHWYEAISVRNSRRVFLDKPVEEQKLKKIYDLCNNFSPFLDARAIVFHSNEKNFLKGMVGHYGEIKNASNYIAFIGDETSENVAENVGYTGEAIVLEATALGLDTCWVGGFFRPEVVGSVLGIKLPERVFAITPIGYAKEDVTYGEILMHGVARSKKRLPLQKLLVDTNVDQLQSWMITALEAARLAPSAVNRQPWRFKVEGETIAVLTEKVSTYGIPPRLDCGIAALHLVLGAIKEGIDVRWSPSKLHSPYVGILSKKQNECE